MSRAEHVTRQHKGGKSMSFGGFSWKRALGITSAKRKIAKATGIPTTKAGRKRKAQNMLWKGVFGKPRRRKRR